MADNPLHDLTRPKRFSLADCQEFSRLSGDVNPMHLDAVAARRLLAGRVVVHGSNVLLSALEHIASSVDYAIVGIGCEFSNPVCVGDEVTFRVRSGTVEDRLSVIVGMQTCATIRLAKRVADAEQSEHTMLGSAVSELLEPLEQPLSRPPEEWVGTSARVALPSANFETAFPETCRWIGVPAIRSIAATSYIVGMVCPGLHSIASSYRFALTAELPPPDALEFTVDRFDSRFHLLEMRLSGSVSGVAKAFVRPPPVDQPSARELAKHVRKDEFAGVRSLVVGASRGIGEATAKLLAAGGSDIVLTWASGLSDCQRVAADIISSGGRCSIVRFRAGTDNPADVLRESGPVDHAYYFPTPSIFRKAAGVFDRARFDEFIDVYAEPFVALCEALNKQARVGTVRIFHPSSTAVTERPRGVTEYAMAKAAIELLADDLDRTLPHITIIGERLPRIATDQTATVFNVAAMEAWEAILPVIRRMYESESGHPVADVSPDTA